MLSVYIQYSKNVKGIGKTPPLNCIILKRRRRNRKRLLATASRSEGVYNRAGEPGVTFCEKGGAVEWATDFL